MGMSSTPLLQCLVQLFYHRYSGRMIASMQGLINITNNNHNSNHNNHNNHDNDNKLNL